MTHEQLVLIGVGLFQLAFGIFIGVMLMSQSLSRAINRKCSRATRKQFREEMGWSDKRIR